MARFIALLGRWSAPPDLPAKMAVFAAALFALFVVFGRGRSLLTEEGSSKRSFLSATALIAALLSLAYVALYLKGGPRIIDATTYFLQGRALSHGDLSWTPIDPSASFRGRFLVYRADGPDAPSLGGIFPPGYPLLLAFGFVIGAPMIVGPLLAAALVVATYRLGRALAEPIDARLAEPIARGAALLSVVSGALRYHTADTMSHGASALGITLALTFALRRRPLAAGLAIGFVVATRPVSAIPIALVAAWLLRRELRRTALGLVPGVFLFLLSQRAVTGAWFDSTQRMYYAMSDGPTGCFRWGFGKGTGCLFEHGDFVAARLPKGYGVVEALGTTVRRLHKHLLDVANFEPLALLVLLPVVHRRAVIATALVVLQILVYLPFYFDGDYPGGGARFFADVLPVEHVLVAIGVATLPFAFHRSLLAVIAIALLGFGVHAVHDHLALRDRDGGRPMFEGDVLTNASISRGLVFVDTDHGFALGHDPAMRPKDGVVVARVLHDARDRMVYDKLGQPPAWLYRYAEPPTLTPWTPPELGSLLRFEAEAEWPALSQSGGYAAPAFTHACASQKRALVLTPEASSVARAEILLPVPRDAEWSVEVHIVGVGRGSGTVTIEGESWSWVSTKEDTCLTLPGKPIKLRPPHAIVRVEAKGGPVGVDHFVLRAR